MGPGTGKTQRNWNRSFSCGMALSSREWWHPGCSKAGTQETRVPCRLQEPGNTRCWCLRGAYQDRPSKWRLEVACQHQAWVSSTGHNAAGGSVQVGRHVALIMPFIGFVVARIQGLCPLTGLFKSRPQRSQPPLCFVDLNDSSGTLTSLRAAALRYMCTRHCCISADVTQYSAGALVMNCKWTVGALAKPQVWIGYMHTSMTPRPTPITGVQLQCEQQELQGTSRRACSPHYPLSTFPAPSSRHLWAAG
jgi:hypothetical protein